MAAEHTWVCLLLWISSSTQDTIPDARVTCLFSEECVLPCSFQPASDEVISWHRQEVVVYSFLRGGGDGEWSEHEQYAGRTSLFTQLVSRGNASLHLRECGPKDRGRYRCQVRTSAGMHEAHVIVTVEAPIRSLTLELSRLSGYEEVQCSTRGIYPSPHVTWATDPPTAEPLRPSTRMLADRQGLYAVESRLRRLKDQLDLIYICKLISSYGTQNWTASLREREISGVEGRDLTIPCQAPPYLRNSSLSWSFTNHNEPALILTYDSLSQHSSVSGPWEGRARLDVIKAPSGDGSLRLVNPDSLHTGTYTCVYSLPQSTHTEHTSVNISAVTGERLHLQETSRWWIIAVVIAVLALVLIGIVGYLKVKGSDCSQPSKTTEDTTEMQPVKNPPDPTAKTDLCESSPLTQEEANGHS